jgi:hypothetical protein
MILCKADIFTGLCKMALTFACLPLKQKATGLAPVLQKYQPANGGDTRARTRRLDQCIPPVETGGIF